MSVSFTMRDRVEMQSNNKLKLGLFGANCSSGRAVTRVPERWSGAWAENVRLAKMADDSGIEFMLPIGRWKGYGGSTEYQDATFETVTWAAGLLAQTRNLTIFGTVHAPLIHPVTAAKEFVTADHIGSGRFGLNVVCGWNEGEFDMFGATQRDHEKRYDYAQEWLDAIKTMWERDGTFDIEGEFLKLKGVRSNPKPYGGSRPIIMNAGASPTGQAFAVRNCDALFSTTSRGTLDEMSSQVERVRSAARQRGRELDVYTVGVVTCRPSSQEAEEYYHHCVIDEADWGAVDTILGLRGITSANQPLDEFQRIRNHTANGLGGLPIIGNPDVVASGLARLSEVGLKGIAVSFVNYLEELPYFCAEVLPRLERMGLRMPVSH